MDLVIARRLLPHALVLGGCIGEPVYVTEESTAGPGTAQASGSSATGAGTGTSTGAGGGVIECGLGELPVIAPCGGLTFGFDDAASFQGLFSAGSCASIVGGELSLTADSANFDCVAFFDDTFPLADCQLSLRIVAGPTLDASIGFFLFEDTAPDDYVAFLIYRDLAQLGVFQGAVYTAYDAAMDPMARPYFRLRALDGGARLALDSSSDGVCFVPLADIATPAFLTQAPRVDISLDHPPGGAPVAATVDDLNL